MTIKRRLFLSSIILVASLLLVGLMIMKGGRVAMKSLEIPHSADFGYFQAMTQRVEELAAAFRGNGNEEALKREVYRINKYHSINNFNLLLYKDGRRIAGGQDNLDPDFRELLRSAQTGQMIQIGRNAAYKIDAGRFRLILSNSNYVLRDGGDLLDHASLFLMSGLALILITVLLSYFFLMKFVFRRIVAALETLVAGANQIRDGNLNYRIGYKSKDEFKEACEAFNEMAVRLSDSVRQQQKDEESRRQLIAGISHDLRTPLTSIKAYAEGLLGGVAVTEEKRDKYLNTIKMKAEDLEKIIQQLFAFSKLDLQDFPLDLVALDLNEELAHIVESVKDEYEQNGLSLSLEGCQKPLPVKIDQGQLRSVLYNVFDNSLKYRLRPQGHLRISGRLSGSMAEVVLSDDGPGVPEEALDSLFDVFYRVDEARSNSAGGSGLGLAISARIVKQMGGEIRAENRAGGGLSIFIQLPLNEQGSHEGKNTDH